MPTVVFLGAGSVVFTRQLLADLFRFDDLPELRVVLHDIDAERLDVARGTAEQVAERFGRHPEVVATLDRREALDGADFVVNMIQVGGIDATRVDLLAARRGRGCARPSATPPGSAGCSAGCGRSRCSAGSPPTCSSSARTRCFLNYTNPMAMNVWWLSVVAPQLRVVGLCHSVYWTVQRPVRAGRRAAGGHPLPRGRGQPPGVADRVEPRRRGPLPAPARGDRRRPRARAPGPGRDLLAASATTRPRPASTPRSTCPGSCARTRRSAGSGSSRWSTSASPRPTSPSSRARAPRWPRGVRSSWRKAPPSTRRRSSTRSSPAPCGRSTRTW